MDQQLTVTTIVWVACFVINVHARRHMNTDVFTGDIDRTSSTPPRHQYWLYQGDIKLTEYQNDMLDNPDKKIDITKAFSQAMEEKRLWFRGIIPYVIDCSLKNMPGLVAIIKRAMKEWESKTCVTFVERDNQEDYITLMRGTHCYSTVGKVKGEKVLSVGHGCEYHNVMLHEIGHAIGFWHEQSRPDRDEHVRILWRNIRQGWESAFVKLSYKATSSMLMPYDYSSIMHYPFNAFSKSSRKRTIVALRPVLARPYKKLSKFDILRVNILYGCKGRYSNDVETTSSPSVLAYRRMKRGVEDVEDLNQYKSQRKQRSVECKNNDGDEACQYWADHGFCITRKDFMLTDCAKSCNRCSTDEHYRPSLQPHVTTASHTTSVRLSVVERQRRRRRRDGKRKARKEVRETYRKRLKLCVDKKKECSYWSRRGFCEARRDLMLKQCRKSCNKCYPDPSYCIDRDSRCKYWAKHHYCRRKEYKTVLKTFCQKSCGHCITDKKGCRDKEYDKCPQWRKHGLCSSRDKEVAEAMKIMCAWSCGVCGEQKQHEEAIKTLCKDKFKACSQWQKRGQCETKKDFMNKYCKESCNTCFTSNNHFEDCVDNTIECDAYKASGKCEKNTRVMFRICRKTCGFCVKQKRKDVHILQQGVPCSDKSSSCPQWSKLRYCEKTYVLFMIKNCPKSCGLCHDGISYATDVDVQSSSRQAVGTKPCINLRRGCNYWARIGYCSLRPDHMLKLCKLACRACHPEKKCENIEDDHNCQHWAKLGKCSSRMEFMIKKCPKSCNACPSRKVKTKPEKPAGILCPTACKNWLEKGFCFKLKNRCRRTCLAGGCDTAPVKLDGFCGNPMGAGWDFKLPDIAFNASSVLENGNWDFGARNARLYKEDDPVYRRVGAWCAKEQKDQWLQVDLGSVKIITAVATQGRDQFFEHVKSYELGFSNDGITWYKYKEKGTDTILRGNCDHFTPVINPLHTPHASRYVRFYPKTHNNVCMRVEIYGCNHLEGKAFKKYGKIIYPERRKHA